MKHFFTFLLTLVVTLGWAQKKELKQAQKLYKSAKISEAKASLDANQALLESAELKYAAPYNLLRSQITLARCTCCSLEKSITKSEIFKNKSS